MDRATCEEKMAELKTRQDDNNTQRGRLTTKMTELRGERSLARERGNSTEELDAKLEEARQSYDELLRQYEGIRAERTALNEEIIDGFDYARPDKSRVDRRLNRLMPSVPKGVKEVNTASELPLRAWSVATLSGVCATAVVGCVLLVILHEALWVIKAGPLFVYFTPEEVEALNDKGAGFLAAVGMIAGAVMVLGALGWSDRNRDYTLVRQCRYVLGAESWSWSGRLRAQAVYATTSAWSFFIPLLTIPLRFVSGVVGMIMYLRHLKKSGNAAEAIAMSAQYANCVARGLVGLLGFALGISAPVLLLM